MNRESLFYKSVNILQKAYFKDELEYGDCHKCAVGNMLKTSAWKVLFWTDGKGNQQINRWKDHLHISCVMDDLEEAKTAISKYGYSIEEFMKIENVFEIASKKDLLNDKQFSGLCAVIDTLMQIHDFNEEEKQSIPDLKQVFNKSELVLITA